ncbi:nitrate- and nitrite sensing domain-containing protein [Amycolatopsis sp. NPDC047767]|uniref:sensor histidine kinase n=1 Tax=Amycolatopsis sp. NPDC047767 TaxID=3156765 RepID=UPI00345137A7
MRHGRTRPRWAGARVLSRLGIRGKLNLLLLPPLAAVLLVSVPFVVKQTGSVASADDTVRAAWNTQELSGLVWQVQREGVLAAAFVASPSTPDSDLVHQQQTVDATVGQLRTTLGAGAPAELKTALTRVASLGDERQNTLHRSISAERIARTYDTVVSALIDGLQLVPRTAADAEGARQLSALEALLRSDEEESLRVTALVVAAQSQSAGQSLLDEATQRAQVHADRFTQLAGHDQAAILADVDSGEAAHRVDQLATQLPEPDAAPEPYVHDVVAAGQQQAAERRTAQDRVTAEINAAAGDRAAAATRLAWLVGGGAAVLFGLVAFLAIAVSRSIAEPLRRLTSAATSVADLADAELVRVGDTETDDDQTPRLATIDVASDDELGELATAFNRVQTTAAALVERQTLTRRNTSLMFANVAKRTQNLVGRQLALVDELERHEQDSRALAGLFRLDHLSARLRRTADNLLVISGTHDENPIAGPIQLSTAVRAALAEIEDFPRVRLGELPDVQLTSSLGADLVRLFAELLENATSFSAPTTSVEVETEFLESGDLVVAIVDHGIGMAAESLAQENRRLLERERLELAPTSVLGLFVAGRLARRHSLGVELTSTPDTGGVTARVTVPAAQFDRMDAPVEDKPVESAPAAEAAGLFDAGRAPEPLPAPAIAVLETASLGFTWFRDPEPEPEPEPGPEWPDAEPDEPPASGFILDGDDLATSLSADPPVPAQQTVETAVARAKELAAKLERTKSAVHALTTQRFAPLDQELTRRVPGAQLAPGLKAQQTIRTPLRAVRRGLRDPAAERAVFDSYSDGVAKADASRATATANAGGET